MSPCPLMVRRVTEIRLTVREKLQSNYRALCIRESTRRQLTNTPRAFRLPRQAAGATGNALRCNHGVHNRLVESVASKSSASSPQIFDSMTRDAFALRKIARPYSDALLDTDSKPNQARSANREKNFARAVRRIPRRENSRCRKIEM